LEKEGAGFGQKAENTFPIPNSLLSFKKNTSIPKLLSFPLLKRFITQAKNFLSGSKASSPKAKMPWKYRKM
jgi:hypothetical protein